MNEVIIKSQEVRTGVRLRILKDGEYKLVDIPFKTYFYVMTALYELYEEQFLLSCKYAIDNVVVVGPFSKIILKDNFQRTRLREFWETRKVQTYEADIKANMRWLLNHPNIPLHNEKIPYAFFDIETDDRLPLLKDENGIVIAQSEILSYSRVDWKGEKKPLINTGNEQELLLQILQDLSKYGCISGWYSEGFDMPFIKQRCLKYNISIDILEYINHIDYLELYKKFSKKTLKSYSLNSVAEFELKKSKIDQKKGHGEIYKTWKENPKQLEDYNLEDSNLIYELNKKLSFIEISARMANDGHCHIRNTFNDSDIGDYLLLSECQNEHIVTYSKPTQEQILQRKAQGRIGGGYTTCFKPGLHKSAKVWDYKSFYPSLIITFNIGPDTFVRNMLHDEYLQVKDTFDYTNFIITPDDTNDDTGGTRYHPHRVYRRQQGVFSIVCQKLMKRRDAIKYSMAQYEETDPDKYKALYQEQYGIKTNMNALYGIMSFANSRWYLYDCGDTVTTCARHIIKKCGEKLNEWGCEGIGGDTDSQFVIMAEGTNANEIDQKFIKFLDEYMASFHIDKHVIIFEYEKKYEPFLFIKKKNYAGLEFEYIGNKVLDKVPIDQREYNEKEGFWYFRKGKLKIKGLEAIKSDINRVAAGLQKELIEDILYGKYEEPKWRSRIKELYNRVTQKQMAAEELVLVKALTKMPKDYAGYIIDKKTKKPKIKADGTIQIKSIPAHVKLVERLNAAGRDIVPGDKVKFIVVEVKPIVAIDPSEFKGEYVTEYYWTRIIKPTAKVLYTINRSLPKFITENMAKKDVNKILEDDEDD